MTTSKETRISFCADARDSEVRIEIDGTVYRTAKEVNSKLRDELVHRQETGIDKTDHTRSLSMKLINFPNGLDGIVLCDVPGAATITSEKDEIIMKKCLRAPGISILLSKVSNKNSAIIKLANTEPTIEHNTLNFMLYVLRRGLQEKNFKDNLSPEPLAQLREMVHAEHIIQTF